MKNGIDFAEMLAKLKELADQEGVDLTDYSDIQVIEPLRKIKFDTPVDLKKQEEKDPKKLKQKLLARLRSCYLDYMSEAKFESFRDFAQRTGLYMYVRRHPELWSMDLSDRDLISIMRCEWGNRRGY